MKSTKILAILIIVVAVGVALFSVAVAAVTAAPSYPDKVATLIVEKGTVELKAASSDSWREVTSEVDVEPGDKVRTGANSAASIEYFDEGVTRLDQNTEITIENLEWNSASNTFIGSVKLETGRIWSRLLDFISPESEFEVQTGSTVATVRGTAFSVGVSPNGQSSVYVDDHEVQVGAQDSSSERLVKAGNKVRVMQPVKGAPHAIFPTHFQEMDELKWIDQNRKHDKEFHERIMKKKKEEAKELRRIGYHSPLYLFLNVAEKIRLATTFSEARKAELRRQFAMGRVLDAYNIREIDPVCCAGVLDSAEKYQEGAGTMYDQMLKREEFTHAEGWNLPGIEDNLINKTETKDLEDVDEVADSEEPPEIDHEIPSDDNPDTGEQFFEPAVEPGPEPIPETYNIEDALVPFGTEPEPEPQPEPEPEPTPTSTVELVVYADQPIIPQNGSSVVRAYLVGADDSYQDVSAFVHWNVIGDAGYMEGNLFIGANMGVSEVQAEYRDNGNILVGVTYIDVREALDEPIDEPIVDTPVDEPTNMDALDYLNY